MGRRSVLLRRVLCHARYSSLHLSFGLVNIPVKLYTAAHSKSVAFHLLHAKDGSRIREQMVCQSEHRPVDRKELVKGYELSKSKCVEVSNEELNALEAEANRSVEIQEFVPRDSVDAVYFSKIYYLGTDKGGDKPYRLLAQAMHQEVYRTRFSGQRVNLFMPLVDAAPQRAPELGHDSRAAQ